MAWDPAYYDPYAVYGGYDAYQGYDAYGHGGQSTPQENSESEKQRKDQAEKQRLEALESNRLYLKKVRKECVKEDFSDLKREQIFLFEVLIESLEVDSEPDLGITESGEDVESYVSARIQFLNSPYLVISEKDMESENSSRTVGMASEYFQVVGQAGLADAVNSTRSPEGEGKDEEEPHYSAKWESARGKSCLFTMSTLDMIQGIWRYPVNVQVLRCTIPVSPSLDDKEQERNDDKEDHPDEEQEQEGRAEPSEPLGYVRVRLPDEFSLAILQSCKPDVILPVSSTLRQECDIHNVFGVKKGRLELFVRLSAFGPVIITSFQAVGDDRRYVFKPSPIDTKDQKEETEKNRNEILKPVVAEESKAIGISVLREPDIFQKPVFWKKTPNCGCKASDSKREVDVCFTGLRMSTDSMRVPRSSSVSLCRDIMAPKSGYIRQFKTPLCDWHNLVGLEVKNSPGENCGCLDGINKILNGTPRELKKAVIPFLNPLPTGIGMKPEPQNCGCDCSSLKESIQAKKKSYAK